MRPYVLAASLVVLIAPAVLPAAQGPATPAPSPRAAARAVTRISYWTTRPGKAAEARAFWRPIAQVFQEMKTRGLVVEYAFLEPAIHTGQDWDLAYVWICRDMAAYGAADQYFGEALAKMDTAKIEVDFNATFDGSRHRDEIWHTVDIR